MVRVFVAPVASGEARAMDMGAETDMYVPRVNWLPDSKRLAIQRLNRTQTTVDVLIADAATGKRPRFSRRRTTIGSTSTMICIS